MLDTLLELSPATQSVTISFTLTAGEIFHSLICEDANGTHQVKLQAVPDLPGRWICPDYEVALTGPASYELVTSIGVAHLDTTAARGDAPMIHCVTNPALYVTPGAIANLATAREWAHRIWDVIDSPYPVVAPGPARSRTGVLLIPTESLAQANAIESVLSGNAGYLLRTPEHEGQDLYFVPTESKIVADTPAGAATIWSVEISWREIAAPIGLLRSLIGHTYADDLGAYPTYRASQAAHPTYLDRMS